MFLSQNIYAQSLLNDSKICNEYRQFLWLPNAYLANAFCACTSIPTDSQSAIVRHFLIESLNKTDSIIVKHFALTKELFNHSKIKKRKYKRHIKKEIVPMIVKHHREAYQSAGCSSGPASYGILKIACLHEFKNCKRMIRRGLFFGGSCHHKRGAW